MRWGLCWYGQAAVNRSDAGSIPASAASVGQAFQPDSIATAKLMKHLVSLERLTYRIGVGS